MGRCEIRFHFGARQEAIRPTELEPRRRVRDGERATGTFLVEKRRVQDRNGLLQLRPCSRGKADRDNALDASAVNQAVTRGFFSSPAPP